MKNLILLFALFFVTNNPSVDQKEWKFIHTKEGVSIYNREVKGSNLKEFKGEVTVNASLSTIMAVVTDIDNYPNWVYQTKVAKILKKETDNLQYLYVVIKGQWPVQDRDIVYKCQVTQNPSTQEVVISMIGAPNFMPPQKDIVRMPEANGAFTLTPVGKDQTKVTYQLQAATGGIIPQWVADLVVVDSPYVTLNNLRQEIKKDKYRNIASY
ncbi:MAG TPA: START domain-containing protein [Prolixibacteraceae bacterium]|nr:START domain-containing protein [Prolixibacteraceae bacterium]HPS13261.1 START domain-containing protein [Prolixibacteraceae bacterium]